MSTSSSSSSSTENSRYNLRTRKPRLDGVVKKSSPAKCKRPSPSVVDREQKRKRERMMEDGTLLIAVIHLGYGVAALYGRTVQLVPKNDARQLLIECLHTMDEELTSHDSMTIDGGNYGGGPCLLIHSRYVSDRLLEECRPFMEKGEDGSDIPLCTKTYYIFPLYKWCTIV